MQMSNNQILEKAIEIAIQYHKGQVDLKGEPYILHPLSVMESVRGNLIVQAVAVLHDAVEDTDLTLDTLRKIGFSNDIVEAIDHISRRPSEKYNTYVLRVRNNNIACVVKMHDIRHNLSVERLCNLEPSKVVSLNKRYSRAVSLIWENYVKASKELYGEIL